MAKKRDIIAAILSLLPINLNTNKCPTYLRSQASILIKTYFMYFIANLPYIYLKISTRGLI